MSEQPPWETHIQPGWGSPQPPPQQPPQPPQQQPQPGGGWNQGAYAPPQPPPPYGAPQPPPPQPPGGSYPGFGQPPGFGGQPPAPPQFTPPQMPGQQTTSGPAPTSGGGRRNILFIVIGIVAIVGAAAAIYFVTNGSDKKDKKSDPPPATPTAAAPATSGTPQQASSSFPDNSYTSSPATTSAAAPSSSAPAPSGANLDTDASDKTPFTADALVSKTFTDSKQVAYTLKAAGPKPCDKVGDAVVEPLVKAAKCTDFMAASWIAADNKIIVSAMIIPYPDAATAQKVYQSLSKAHTGDYNQWCPPAGQPGADACTKLAKTANVTREGKFGNFHRYLLITTAVYADLRNDDKAKDALSAAADGAFQNTLPGQ